MAIRVFMSTDNAHLLAFNRDPSRKYLRAIDVRTGRIAWELPQDGPATRRGGVPATAAGLLFFCADSNESAAAD